ncbi:MAG: tRNA (adenosine(37)-N6)-threonylcarbamoyltransferase complex dimerization subunit type 1 TsaB [Treponema sp.]|nr:MAG: tRNA (adenosine(37)-N6)-threonylcarbamoyltransferase complex dimerization subunit type 1 TsaB [Treponema sp.]
MNIISIDTITNQISITAEGPNGTYTNAFSPKTRRHTESIIPMMSDAVEQAGFQANETEIVICAEGPGTFTGLRSAYATAKAINLKTNAKLIPVPTLECMAQMFNSQDNAWCDNLLTLIDAKRNRFYGQLFNKKIAKTDTLDEPIETFLKLCDLNKPCIFLGRGIMQIQERVKHEFNAPVIFIEEKSVFSLSMLNFFHQNKEQLLTKTVNDYCAPVYIRKSDAEKPQK